MNSTLMVKVHFEDYIGTNKLDASKFGVLIEQINLGHDLQDRKTLPGHVTSSFMLLNPELDSILMIYHKGLGKWLCPGGHYEGDVAPRVSALRELTEETGFPIELVDWFGELSYLALDIDTHVIPARPDKDEEEHFHHDFLYIGKAKAYAELNPQLEEVFDVKWVSLEEASELPDERVRRAVEKAKKLINDTVSG